MKFIGREKELKRLKESLNRSYGSVVALYGRRRVGKSALIAKALEDFPGMIISFVALDKAGFQKNFDLLKNKVREALKEDYLDFKSVGDLFRYLYKKAELLTSGTKPVMEAETKKEINHEQDQISTNDKVTESSSISEEPITNITKNEEKPSANEKTGKEGLRYSYISIGFAGFGALMNLITIFSALATHNFVGGNALTWALGLISSIAAIILGIFAITKCKEKKDENQRKGFIIGIVSICVCASLSLIGLIVLATL